MNFCAKPAPLPIRNSLEERLAHYEQMTGYLTCRMNSLANLLMEFSFEADREMENEIALKMRQMVRDINKEVARLNTRREAIKTFIQSPSATENEEILKHKFSGG